MYLTDKSLFKVATTAIYSVILGYRISEMVGINILTERKEKLKILCYKVLY